MIDLFHTLVYQPLYNALIALISVVPGHNVALAVVLLTFIVKLLLLPFSIRNTKTQIILKKIAPEVERIRKEEKDQYIQAKKILELYKKHGAKPFSGMFLMLLQLPVIISLYFVFLKGGLPQIDTSLLYPFTPLPEGYPDMSVFGIFRLDANHNLVFAILAGISQYLVSVFAMPQPPQLSGKESKDPNEIDISQEIARSMHLQMKYFMPVLIAIISYTLSAIVAIYFIANNIFTVAQELIMRKLHGTVENNGDSNKTTNNSNT